MGQFPITVGTSRCDVRAAFSGATCDGDPPLQASFRPLCAAGDAAARRPYLKLTHYQQLSPPNQIP
jgi:hypothetical protein